MVLIKIIELSSSRNLTDESSVNIQPVILKIYGSDIMIKSPYKMGNCIHSYST